MRVGYNPKHGTIKTDAGVTIDRAFLAHLKVVAADAVAASETGVLPLTNLSAAAQVITTGITNPAVPRNIRIDGNVSGIDGTVTINGKNYAGEDISEEIIANGINSVDGALAFKTVDSIELPIQDHTPVAQVETATVVGTITTTGNATVTVTAAGMTNSPKAISVPVVENDNAAAIAEKMRDALEDDDDVTAMFSVGGTGAAIILTKLVPAANDATLNIAIADDTSAGITEAATSSNTTAGVPYDKISVGWGDVLGLPFKLEHNTVLAAYLNNVKESTAPTVTVDADEIEKNTIDLHSALDGHQVDVYLIV